MKQFTIWIKSRNLVTGLKDLSNLDLSNLDLSNLDLSNKNFSKANLSGAILRWADLSWANLRWADLSWANLRWAILREADLSGADLSGADLSGAILREAILSKAILYRANLREAILSKAILYRANLRWANLREANLSEANLRGADIENGSLPFFQIPEGEIIGWKKINNHIIKLEVPKKAKRNGTPISRKCRAEFVKILSIEIRDKKVTEVIGGYKNESYKSGEVFYPDSYNDDIRIECTNGVHFFLTKQEAIEY